MPKMPGTNGTTEVAEEVVEEKEDGSKAEVNEENEDIESGKEDATDPDRVPGDGKGGEVGKDDDGKGPEDETEVESEPTLEEKFKAQEEKIRLLEEKYGKEPEKKEEEKPLPQRTPEQWQALADEYEIPVKAVQAIERNQIDLARRVVTFIRSEMTKAFGGQNRDKAIESMASKFKDISNYKDGIVEFLGHYKVEDHANPVLLEKAYYYAKGKGADKTVRKAIQSNEINRKVVKRVASTKGSSSNGKGDKVSLKLSPQEEAAWESFGQNTFDSKEEFARSLKRNRK